MSAPVPDFDLAARFLADLQRESGEATGVTRDSYGPGEQRAHVRLQAEAQALGLEVAQDGALNTYVTLPGCDRKAPGAVTGSHLDSVPRGGNYDGAAGVAAGLAVLAGWQRAGYVPARDITVMAVRAEESTWFPYSYLGSKAAFGLVSRSALELKRADTGRTLADHLRDCGGDPARFGAAHFRPEAVGRYVELHIEQGPVLVEEKLPVGMVTGIRGSFRFRDGQAHGQYAHSGAVPRAYRRDAVRAVAQFVTAMDGEWETLEKDGRDLALTFGQLGTDPAEHAFSKVAGECAFCLDVRSLERETLAEVERRARAHAEAIGRATGVRFELGERTGSDPALMDAGLVAAAEASARAHGIACRRMASGAGHDAAVFAQQGVPSAMVFVRNDGGSHNAGERMERADFDLATRVLADLLAL